MKLTTGTYIRPFKVDCLFCIQKDSSLYAGVRKTKHGLFCSVCFCLGHNKSYMHGDTKQTINFKRPYLKNNISPYIHRDSSEFMCKDKREYNYVIRKTYIAYGIVDIYMLMFCLLP